MKHALESLLTADMKTQNHRREPAAAGDTFEFETPCQHVRISVAPDMAVSDVIRRLVKAYGETPFRINAGNCDYFAYDLAETLKAMGRTDVLHDETPDISELPGHCWLVVANKCYDAETPNGVKHWRQLPLFRNILRRQQIEKVPGN